MAESGFISPLSVDDHRLMREGIVRIVGLQPDMRVVAQAASGEEALKVAAAHQGTINLLLSDVVMPGMKGPELADRLRQLRPGIRVLLMSGYAADVVTPSDLGDASLLPKPFSPSVLGKAVRSILEVPLPSAPSSRG